MMRDFDLTVGGETLRITDNSPVGNCGSAHVVIIHGAGRATRQRTAYLSEYLIHQNCRTIRFDHSGHGDSTGSLDGSTLLKRLDETRAVIDHTWDGTMPLILVGSSMGGFEAAMMTRDYPVSGLGLVVPAAYAADAMDVPFGPAFRAVLQMPGSYQTSPSFEVLKSFRGRSALVVAGADQTIPPDITDRYAEILSATSENFDHVMFPDAPHLIHDYLQQNEPARRRYLEVMERLLSKLLPYQMKAVEG